MTIKNTDNKQIFVTSPLLPPLEEFIPYLKSIWETKTLTNNGPQHTALETELVRYLNIKQISLFNNATIALLAAIKALNLKGEIITTPFSFIATTHSIAWNNCKPVFVDIDEESYNIDVNKIEEKITSETSAILAVHCYGTPCNTSAINQIARKHNLKVIYDAAHAFGVEDSEGSVANRGDMSILSFHATKVFNTFEGGAIVCADQHTKTLIDQIKNFGIVSEEEVRIIGINGKMSEINAAFGRLQLKYVDHSIALRKSISDQYITLLSDRPGLVCPRYPNGVKHNYSYFPLRITEEYHKTRDQIYDQLKAHNIYSRKYFYPLITEQAMYRNEPSADSKNVEKARRCSAQVLCLPISPNMTVQEARKIVAIVTAK